MIDAAKILPLISWPQVAFLALFILWEYMLTKQGRVPKSTLGIVVAGFFFLKKVIKERKWKTN